MKKYLTVAGDMWDLIAFKTLGSTLHAEKLINANREHVETFIFAAGVELKIPEVETKRTVRLPPWMVH